ncbi:BamA/TamA family outer membrane protein [Chitinophagaceae bacterium LWZ2-11]
MFLFSKTSLFKNLALICCFALLIASCTVVKNPPANKPFIFGNHISLTGNISKDEKKRLTGELDNYWDDSLKVRKIQQFGIIYKYPTPAVYDSINVIRTVGFMNAYLNSQGYYSAVITDSIKKDTIKDKDLQVRTKIYMKIDVGKNITIDSVAYKMSDTALQQLTKNNIKGDIKKGSPYTKQAISTELDRITTLYHQNGYYKLVKDDFYALVDTLDDKLLKLSLDPAEQAQLILDAAQKRKENPTWSVTFLQRPIFDSSKLTQFYIGKIYYYPELRDYDNVDSLNTRGRFTEAVYKNGMVMRYRENKFRLRPLREHTFLKSGDLYKEDLYYKSINALSQIGTWKQVDIQLKQRGADSLDAYFYMIPNLKQSFSVNVETSVNTGEIGSGNFLGIATSFSYRNRNVWKQAIQSVTNLRFGVELNVFGTNGYTPSGSLLQTIQYSASQTYTFPRFIIPNWNFLKKWTNGLDNKRTSASAAINYTDRRDYYLLRSFTTSWGYEASKGTWSYSVKFPNVELYKLDTLAGLLQLFQENPFLRNSFRNGNVIGLSASVTKAIPGKTAGVNHLIKFGFEESGLITELIPALDKQVFNYVSFRGEYDFTKKYKKTELATRFAAAIALPQKGETMPVFKQFSMGGPNSMRAWGLRQLGLGSSIVIDTSTTGYTDRYGDLSIEGNIEYRFNLATIGGVKLASALFTDFGNIWNLKNDNATTDPLAIFNFSRLGKDLAIGAGTGLRLDFSYFLLRLDFAYRVKDPARQQNGGWMSFKDFEWTDTRQNGTQVKNFAFQFGIGLPF